MKPIESATIYFAGDRSVGIPSAIFTMTMYIDPVDLVAADWDEGYAKRFLDEELKQVRYAIASCYETIHGERPTVTFDFEEAERAAREDAMARAQSQEGGER